MAEQKACSDIVTAALADEAAADRNNQNMELRSEQGESLLLPLLVQQLRYRSNSNQCSEVGVDDSGTESGEDLKLLAVGLRDSIELQRQSQKLPASEALGPSLLAEVQTALSRLEASLTLGNSELDPSRKDALLQLVARLQSSLHLPAPPWSKADAKQQSPPQNQRRFSNRKARQNRHTVGVSREELADARRLMEATSTRDKVANDAVKHENTTTVQEALPFSKVPTQQSSAGDLFSMSSDNPTSSQPSAFQAYRPVSFAPPRRASSGYTPIKGDLVPFPFESPQGEDFSKSIQAIHKPLTQTVSLDSGTNKEYISTRNSDDPKGTSNSEPVRMRRPSDIIGQVVADRMNSENEILAYEAVPSLTSESQSFQQSQISQKSGSGSSVAGKVQHVSYSRSSSINSKDSVPLDSRRSTSLSSSYDSNPNSKESTPLRLEKPVVSMIKPKRLPLNSSSNSNESVLQNYSEKSFGKAMSQSSGSVDSSQTDSKESIPQHVDKETSQHRILNQSVSLDNSVGQPDETAGQHISHSCSLDSARSDYDPSVLLFTPAQSVQIAVHKAAINKQISIEAEKRLKTNRNVSESDVESSDEMVSSEESGGSDSEQDDDEEEEESSTLRQADSVKLLNDYVKNGPSREAPRVPNVKKMLAYSDSDKMSDNRYFSPNSDINTKMNGVNSIIYPNSVPSKDVAEPASVTSDNRFKVTHEPVTDKISRDLITNEKHDISSFNGGFESSKNKVNAQTNVVYKENSIGLGAKPAPVNQEHVNKMIWNGSKDKQTVPVSQEYANRAMWNGLNHKQVTPVSQESVNKMPWTGGNDNIITQRNQDPVTKAAWAGQQTGPLNQESVNKPIWSGVNGQQTAPLNRESNKMLWNGLNDKQSSNPSMKHPHDSQTPQVINNVNASNEENVSSAQRLLQMATEDPNKTKQHSRKLKMKRANTIDIPKPLNFYQVDADSDCSSDDEAANPSGRSSEHRAAYIALRGPIRVGSGWPVESKAVPPSLKPKTESDHKFLALLNKGGATSSEDGSKAISYNPSARGGQPWSNRFSNIKTAFESGPAENKPMRLRSNSGPANARLFWQSADDSVTMRKSSTPSSNGPKLSRQGSIFLHRLHEQKDLEKQAKLPWTDKKQINEPSKLPWNDKYTKDSVVVGSLTVAAKGTAGTVQSKKQLFTPTPPPIVNRPVNINKFSHAPMSAFRPIEKKPTTVSKTSAPTTLNVEPLPNPWASSTVSGNVKQLASQKFCGASLESPSNPKAAPQQKQTKLPEYIPKHELLSPVSPTLPWNQKNTSDHRTLLTAVDKFENISRDLSPQPVVHAHKIPPPPPPRALLNVPKQPPHIPSPPMLSAPDLIHNYNSTDNLNHQTELNYNNSNHNYNQTNEGQFQNHYIDSQDSIVNYSNSSALPKSSGQDAMSFTQPGSQMQYLEPLQTYSGCVTSRSSVYPNTGFQYKIPPQAKPELSPRPEIASPQSADEFENPPEISDDRFETLPPLQTFPNLPATVSVNHLTPQKPLPNLTLPPSEMFPPTQFQAGTLNSPEEMKTVTRVMTGPVCHQAETVSNKTKHCGDDEPRTSAAQNLSSFLTKFSTDSDLPKRSPQKSPVAFKPDLTNSIRQSPTTLRQSPKYQPISAHKSPTFEALQDDLNDKYLAHQSSSRFHRSPTSGIVRNRSEPNITAMIDEDQFIESQRQLQSNSGIRRTGGLTDSYTHSTSPKSNSSLQKQDNYNMFNNSNYGQYSSNQRSHPLVSMRVRPASTESLITATSTEEFQDSGESVLTTRLQIPVYSNNVPNSGGRVKEGSHLLSVSPRSNSFNERKSPSISPSILQKSESWHQLALQQMRGGRPQSLVLPDLPVKPSNTSKKLQPALPRAKSSHSLANAKQFEAAVMPDTIREKQRAVEAYLSKPTSKPSQPRVTHGPLPGARKQTSSSSKHTGQFTSLSTDILLLDDNLDNVDEAFESLFNAAVGGSKTKENLAPHASNVTTQTEVTTRTSSFSATAVGSTRVVSKAPSGKVMSPFSKFQQMDRQNSQSAPNSPKTPGGTAAGPLFTFTDPKLCRSASGVKDRLLFWCQVKTKEYKNIQIENFSTCWSNGLAFCALIHHFLPDAFDYDSLKPEERRKNFELAFRIADEKADIAPLLDVEDMVMMRKPDWKCVFTYVQSIYRRFKDQD